MNSSKIIKTFVITFIALAVIVIFLIIFSFLSYSFNKEKNITPAYQPATDNEVAPVKGVVPTEMEMYQMLNPGKTEEELLEIKKETESLPYKAYTEEEMLKETSL